MHSRETVTRTSLVGWSRPGLRSLQAHRMKAIGYVTVSENDVKCDQHILHHFFVQTACRLGTTAGASVPCPKELGNALSSTL